MDPERQKLERVLTAYTAELSNEDKDAKVSERESIDKSEATSTVGETQDKGDTVGLLNCTYSLQYVLFSAFYFLTGAALNILRPYLSVYYRQLGLNVRDIGILRSVQPWIAIPWTPTVGYLVAKYRVTKKVLVISLFGTACLYPALYFIPNVRTEEDCTLLISTHCVMGTHEINETGFERVTTTDTTATFLQNKQDDMETGITSISLGSNLSGTCLHPQRTDHHNWYNQDDLRRVFIYLVLVNIACQLVGAAWFPLANATILDALGKEKRNHYAYFKACAAISGVLL